MLHVQDSAGHSVDLPATANAERGGFVVDARALQSSSVSGTVTGQLRGEWGFDPWNGPDFAFTNSRPQEWTFAAGETSAVTAADKISLHLQADSVVCVQGVTVDTPQGKTEKTTITRTPPRLLEVNLPITKSSQGVYTLVVSEYGQTKPEKVPVHVYPPSAVVTGLILHAGDDRAVMTGTHLQEVTTVEMSGTIFHAGPMKHNAYGRQAAAEDIDKSRRLEGFCRRRNHHGPRSFEGRACVGYSGDDCSLASAGGIAEQEHRRHSRR